ncbi:MAG: carbon storage regulator CsrA [Verrucomicrobiota bacterium]|nr:carbon storage regulator CsrA [Limisphaera sp.]MDW8381065.1 carbon storage regulator CsrA [Verrucomicrobiota bacterium]
MLILSRKPGESIMIDGRIHVKVVRVEGDLVKVGIEAPAEVPVHRMEVYLEIQGNNRGAALTRKLSLPRLPVKAAKGAGHVPADGEATSPFVMRSLNEQRGTGPAMREKKL